MQRWTIRISSCCARLDSLSLSLSLCLAVVVFFGHAAVDDLNAIKANAQGEHNGNKSIRPNIPKR